MREVSPINPQTTRLASRVAVCRDCQALFLLAPAQLMSERLPCGHRAHLYLAEENLLAALRDAAFVEWAYNRDLLDTPMQALRSEGGSYNPLTLGPMRLRLPGGDL